MGIDVSGGSGGVVAQCEAITGLGAAFGSASTAIGASALSLHGALVHPAVITSAVFDPRGFAAFEAHLATALDGPGGLSWTAGRCASLDLELRAAALAYEGVDHLAGRLVDAVHGIDGIPAAVRSAAASFAHGNGLGTAAQRGLTSDPEALDMLVTAFDLSGLIAGTAAALPDGQGVAIDLGPGDDAVAATPPRSLADVLTDLGERTDDVEHGTIDVRILTMADGSRRVIVDVTGTKSWTPLPTDDVTSLTTNGRAVSGEAGAYEQGVLAAMRQAGVTAGDKVLIVGHSEGGMVAVTAARDALRNGRFDVTAVVTAGSPVGHTVTTLPRSVTVLDLENDRDIVPHLDGVANPDRPNVTTVHGRFGDGTVRDDHSLGDAYVPLAAEVDRSQDTSIRTVEHRLAPYLRGVAVRTERFQIVRRYR